MGDPAGIGPEVIVKAYPELLKISRPVVIGDASVIADAIDICGAALSVRRIENDAGAHFGGEIPVLDLDNVDEHVYGEVRKEYGAASLAYIEWAIELTQAGEIDAITTAPIHKQATKLAGSTYAGHTGMLADYTGTDNYAMMLVEEQFRVTHVSTHVPLREACDLVTEESVLETIRFTDEALRALGVESPSIRVAGLNPNASDGGLLGEEDNAEIKPAVRRARAEGIEAIGPESPDTV